MSGGAEATRRRRRGGRRPRRQDRGQLVDDPRAVVVEELEAERLRGDALVHHEGVVARALQVLPAGDLELVLLLQLRVPRRVLVLDAPELELFGQEHDAHLDGPAEVVADDNDEQGHLFLN